MKQLYTTFLLLAFVMMSSSVAAQSLSVQPVEAMAGEQATVAVNISQPSAATVLQFCLQLPAGVAVNESGCTVGSAATNHTLSVSIMDNGNYLFVLYNLDFQQFADGVLVNIPVTIGNDATSGNATLYAVRSAKSDAVSHTGTDAAFQIQVNHAETSHTWDFTNWSTETIDNLKADAAASKTEGWSDVEKKATAEAGGEPTALSKDNCFWLTDAQGGELTANGSVIAELEGLTFNGSYTAARSLAIAVNYGLVDAASDFGPYHGASYLWLGGKEKECFTIKCVKAGTTITMGIESHKVSDARGVQLLVGGTALTDADGNAVAAPTTYTEQTWAVPAGDRAVDVVVKNTNGCHIYFIDAETDSEASGIGTVKGSGKSPVVYNLNGQRIGVPQHPAGGRLSAQCLKKGLYIVNGKKMIVK